MKQKILFNAASEAEIRVATVDEKKKLISLDTTHAPKKEQKSSIFRGVVTNVELSLNAAFVSYDAERPSGFLPLKQIAPQYYLPNTNPTDKENAPSIKDLLKERQEIMVQVDKEQRGSKGAALSTYISLAGCFLVLMPNSPNGGGISRRIEGENRSQLREMIAALNIPESMGAIVRTAGVGRSIEELQWDLDILVKHWEAIEKAYDDRPAPFLIHQESDIIKRTIRDHLRKDVEEIIVDDETIFQKTRDYIEQVRPDYLSRIKLYQERLPLFSAYDVETQIESAMESKVRLPSGGEIVITPTEALVSIDVNSARATNGRNIDETALETNREAAEEIARQLRLRDIGGLIVIDFIDMDPRRNQQSIEKCLAEALKMDRARIQIGRISRFGLLEMSRQRLRPSLGETAHQPCPRCEGQGWIRHVEPLALSLLRQLEEEVLKDDRMRNLQMQLPLDLATYVLNEKRQHITRIEETHNIRIIVIPNEHLLTPDYKISKVQGEQAHSYEQVDKPDTDPTFQTSEKRPDAEKPAVDAIKIDRPKPETGLLKRIINILFGQTLPQKKSAQSRSNHPSKHRRRSSSRPNNDQLREAKQFNEQNDTTQSESHNQRSRPRKNSRRHHHRRNIRHDGNQVGNARETGRENACVKHHSNEAS